MKAAVARSKTRLRFIFLLKVKSKLSQCRLRVAEPGLFPPPFEQSNTATVQLVRDQTRDQIDRGHRFGLGLMETGFQNFGDTAETELTESSLEFDEIHDGSCSWILRLMRSRYWISSRMSGST